MCVFAAMWAVIFLRIRPEDVRELPSLEEAEAEGEAEAGVLLR
jgi:hypothetical protein